jgi:hypothetical protein
MNELKQSVYNKRGWHMMHFIAIIILTMSLVLISGQYFTAQEYGGRNTMNKPAGIMNKDIPPIDRKTPSTIKTATFALG